MDRRSFPSLSDPSADEWALTGPLTAEDLASLTKHIHDQIVQNPQTSNCNDSVYTGGPGVAYALARCGYADHAAFFLKTDDGTGRSRSAPTWLAKCERAAQRHPELHTSLLCGTAGALVAEFSVRVTYGACPALCSDGVQLAERYLAIDTSICDCDEWLYGRTGYLVGLLEILRAYAKDGGGPHGTAGADDLVRRSVLYAKQHEGRIGAPEPTEQAFEERRVGMCKELCGKMREVARQIVQSGRMLASQRRKDPPLMYRWMDEEYLGAAHGLAGIYYVLLSAHLELAKYNVPVQPDVLQDVQQGLQWLMRTQTSQKSGGNYYCVEGEDSEKLVHFCHGAPGFCFLFARAAEVFEAGKSGGTYWTEALRLGEVIWRYGLLKKGPGLCHGIAGNAYCFLTLWRMAKDQVWFRRAHSFARTMASGELKYPRSPDNPMSLYEGLAGTMCFYKDLGDPSGARFPLFEF